MAQVAKGDTVQIHYTGKLPDGTVFDSSRDRDPLEFSAGGDELIEGVSEAVLGMAEGESKTVVVPPEKGYGERSDSLVIRVPRNELPDSAKVGMFLTGSVEDDGAEHEVEFQLTELGEDYAVLDGNPPLSGHTLTFDIEVVAIVAPESP